MTSKANRRLEGAALWASGQQPGPMLVGAIRKRFGLSQSQSFEAINRAAAIRSKRAQKSTDAMVAAATKESQHEN